MATNKEDAVLASILRYNEADCRSVAYLHGWLETLRPQGTDYDLLAPQPDTKAKKTSPDRDALEQKKLALAARIREAKIGDLRLRDTIAELLWFHQRAQKPKWWKIFQRQTWSDEDLVDDGESLGALTRDAGVLPKRVNRSNSHSF